MQIICGFQLERGQKHVDYCLNVMTYIMIYWWCWHWSGPVLLLTSLSPGNLLSSQHYPLSTIPVRSECRQNKFFILIYAHQSIHPDIAGTANCDPVLFVVCTQYLTIRIFINTKEIVRKSKVWVKKFFVKLSLSLNLLICPYL